MELTPDLVVYARWGPLALNGTLVFTWLVMALLVGASWLGTRRLTWEVAPATWQNLLEAVVAGMEDQIREAGLETPGRYLPFIGTLFLFIVVSNVLAAVPGFLPPTASLSTPVALAICVFVAVPVFGIRSRGLRGYLRQYVRPTPFMLPFTLIGEVSRTIALAVRLFGNIMSGSLIVAIVLSIAPLFFPVLMQAFGILIGVIQAYVFAVLALVYIASAARTERGAPGGGPERDGPERDNPERGESGRGAAPGPLMEEAHG